PGTIPIAGNNERLEQVVGDGASRALPAVSRAQPKRFSEHRARVRERPVAVSGTRRVSWRHDSGGTGTVRARPDSHPEFPWLSPYRWPFAIDLRPQTCRDPNLSALSPARGGRSRRPGSAHRHAEARSAHAGPSV